MVTNKIELTVDDVRESLDKEIMIGSDETRDGRRKKLIHNAYTNMYSIVMNNSLIKYERGSI